MKKILSYLLLGLYTSIMIKPVLPTVADIFAHIFNYSDHITTVHQHNGKFHVHYEYMEAAKKNSHGDSPYNNMLKKPVAQMSIYFIFPRMYLRHRPLSRIT